MAFVLCSVCVYSLVLCSVCVYGLCMVFYLCVWPLYGVLFVCMAFVWCSVCMQLRFISPLISLVTIRKLV